MGPVWMWRRGRVRTSGRGGGTAAPPFRCSPDRRTGHAPVVVLPEGPYDPGWYRVTRARQHERREGAQRRARKRRRVCLLSANPLALAEMSRIVEATGGMRVTAYRLELNAGADAHEVRVPSASVYVLDAWSTVTATEAVAAALRWRWPDAKLIVLTDKMGEAALFALLRLGVKGLVDDKQLVTQLPQAVQTVADEGLWIPRALLTRFLTHLLAANQPHDAEAAQPARRISQRERQVLDGVLRSLSNKEISSELHISESTVKFHLARLFEKFGVRRRADLILQTVMQPSAFPH